MTTAPDADLAALSAWFGAELRRAGMPVGPGQCARFAAAVTVARPGTPHELYLCALATFTSSREHARILEAVFFRAFGLSADTPGEGSPGLAAPAGERRAGRPASAAARAAREARTHALAAARRTAGNGEAVADADQDVAHRYLGTAAERLAHQDFADLTEGELASLAEFMRGLTLAVPRRRSRRSRRRPGPERIDPRATLRQARRTGGEVFRLIGRSPKATARRLVVLCDISGSMEPYARAMIQLLYCAAGGANAEVFSFATRLTRLTPVLARSLPGPAIERAGRAAPDWRGGTRIGETLAEFNHAYGRRGMARGAVVVIVSDGWETGDPRLLAKQMERLSLVAFRVVWVNPRTKSAGYLPLAAGMAAAWPHCDAVVSGHSLAALEDLRAALADPVRRRVPPRPAGAA